MNGTEATAEFPALLPVDAAQNGVSLTFQRTECKGRILCWDVAQDYRAAVAVRAYGTYQINLYDDIAYDYTVWTDWERRPPEVQFAGERLFLLRQDYAVEIMGYDAYQVYQYADPDAAAQYLEHSAGRTDRKEVGGRRYFLERGNLLFTEGDSGGSFYLTDEGTVSPVWIVLLWGLAIPAGIWMYRNFMAKYRESRSVHDEI